MSARRSFHLVSAVLAAVLALAPLAPAGTAAKMGAMAAGAADRMAPADCDCCTADTPKTSDSGCAPDCTVPGGILAKPSRLEPVEGFRPASPRASEVPDRISPPDPSPPRSTIIG